jgi:hypothetical protein
MSKALRIPLDKSINYLIEIPYTISYVIRKLKQVDNFNELQKEKIPPDSILWDGTQEELSDWIDKVIYKKQPQVFKINVGEIEG